MRNNRRNQTEDKNYFNNDADVQALEDLGLNQIESVTHKDIFVGSKEINSFEDILQICKVFKNDKLNLNSGFPKPENMKLGLTFATIRFEDLANISMVALPRFQALQGLADIYDVVANEGLEEGKDRIFETCGVNFNNTNTLQALYKDLEKAGTEGIDVAVKIADYPKKDSEGNETGERVKTATIVTTRSAVAKVNTLYNINAWKPNATIKPAENVETETSNTNTESKKQIPAN